VTPPVITPTTEDSYDPIVAALDSLVTLNHVVRFNSLEANCFDGSSNSVQCNIPSFSDEVYKERINKINSPIPLSYNSYVKGFIDLYANRKRGLTQRLFPDVRRGDGQRGNPT
jgi:membrane-bound lytic murein transglycosylase D